MSSEKDRLTLVSLRDHSGQPLPVWAEFFEQPAPELGEVISADTSWRRDKKIAPAWLAMFLFLLGKHYAERCTYVCRNGLARFYRWRGHRLRRDMLLFRDADELRTSAVDHYKTFCYTHTTYNFEWLKESGHRCFRIKGKHHGQPASTTAYSFALAAENAWTAYLLETTRPNLDSGETIRFHFKNKWRWVGISDETLTFHFDEPYTCAVEDIAAVSLKGDVVSFHGAEGLLPFDGSGELMPDYRHGSITMEPLPLAADCQGRFKVSGLANARFFFLLLTARLGLLIETV